MLKKYFNRHFHFGRVFAGDGSKVGTVEPARKQASKNFKRLLFLLKILPYLCGVIFVVSFFWDFGPEHSLPPIFGISLPLTALLRTISVSGLIGFGTNWVAIQMLFKPVQRRPIWGQGLIPAQKERIVWQLAGGIHRFILSQELIRSRIESAGLVAKLNDAVIEGVEGVMRDEEFKREVKAVVYKRLKFKLSDEEVRERFTKLIDEKLEENLQTGLKGFVFKTYRRWNKNEYEGLVNGLLDRVPGTVVDILEELEEEAEDWVEALRERRRELEEFLSRLIVNVLDRIDIQKLLSKQMEHFDEARLEQMIWNATNEQLRYIQDLGTLLGILGGLLIWQPEIIGTGFVALVLVLVGIDVLIFNYRKKRGTKA